MPSEATALLVGLPGSGRSTFLAALWHQLESSEIPTAFSALRLQRDRQYLNEIRDKWLAFEEVSGTSSGIDKSVTLLLRHRESGEELSLSIPDFRSLYEEQWLNRRIQKPYVEQLRRSLGLLLFLHSQHVVSPDVLPAARAGTSAPVDEPGWEPKLAPTQVGLVDILQTALGIFERATVMRVAIIVSAWDAVDETTTPESWLARKLPLLDQFLRANNSDLCWRVFGVSAIGGNLADKDELALTPTPSSRVRVFSGSDGERDLSLPLEFLAASEAIRD